MAKVEEVLNSEDFEARPGGGLQAVCKDLRDRCANVVAQQGSRLRK